MRAKHILRDRENILRKKDFLLQICIYKRFRLDIVKQDLNKILLLLYLLIASVSLRSLKFILRSNFLSFMYLFNLSSFLEKIWCALMAFLTSSLKLRTAQTKKLKMFIIKRKIPNTKIGSSNLVYNKNIISIYIFTICR